MLLNSRNFPNMLDFLLNMLKNSKICQHMLSKNNMLLKVQICSILKISIKYAPSGHPGGLVEAFFKILMFYQNRDPDQNQLFCIFALFWYQSHLLENWNTLEKFFILTQPNTNLELETILLYGIREYDTAFSLI